MKYAGIGSRETPYDVCITMYDLARRRADKWLLRSGGADGADYTFEKGCDSVQGQKEIFLASDCTDKAEEFSSKFHPNWNACKPFARKLHGRNAMIILGRNLDDPVDEVWCWTKDGKASGGTGQAIRIAESLGIPIYNYKECSNAT